VNGDHPLFAIARILTTETDLTEALRLVAREVARHTTADTAAAYLLDRERRVLSPVAAYRVPREILPVLTNTALPVDEQGFRESVFVAADVTWSDDVEHDPRFSFRLFRKFRHQSGVVVPIHIDRDVAGAFYLVWWNRREQVDEPRRATLQAIGQQVALLLRAAWALQEARRAEERYRTLVERVPIGLYRTTPDGTILDVNPAMVQILRFPSREALLGFDARSLWVRPDDRRQPAHDGPRDTRAELHTGDGGTIWVRLRSRAVQDSGRQYWEGALEDISAQRRAEDAERRAEALRAVAQLANAAAHEINNPLAVISGRLELIRRHVTAPDQQARFDQALDACKRIAQIIADMGRLTRLEAAPGPAVSPMLDLRASSRPDPED
jgi:PAS domain S-box-containing protein